MSALPWYRWGICCAGQTTYHILGFKMTSTKSHRMDLLGGQGKYKKQESAYRRYEFPTALYLTVRQVEQDTLLNSQCDSIFFAFNRTCKI